MNKEYQKLLEISEKLNSDELIIFNDSCNRIKEIFSLLIDNSMLKITEQAQKNIDMSIYYDAAKNINSLGKKVGVNICVPEEDEYLFCMYAIKYGSEVLFLNQSKQ